MVMIVRLNNGFEGLRAGAPILVGGEICILKAQVKRCPTTFLGKILWLSRMHIGGPRLILEPVAPPERVPVHKRAW